MKAVFRHMVNNLGLVPLLLVFLLILAAATAIALWIFFKLPTKEGGVFGGLDSIEDPEEREAMRRYIFGLDEERPLVGKEKLKAEAKAAKAARTAAEVADAEIVEAEEVEEAVESADEAVEFAAADEVPVAEFVDAEFEVASEETDEV